MHMTYTLMFMSHVPVLMFMCMHMSMHMRMC